MQAIPRRPYPYRHLTPLSCQAAAGQLQLRPSQRILIPTSRFFTYHAVLAVLAKLSRAERALIVSLVSGKSGFAHRCASLSLRTLKAQDWRVPCKDTPGQTTISHFRLSSLTYLPTYRLSSLFPSLYKCACCCLKRHWTRKPTRAVYSSCYLVRTLQFSGARILITTPLLLLSAVANAKASGPYSCSLFGRRISGLGFANPAGVFGCHTCFTRSK